MTAVLLRQQFVCQSVACTKLIPALRMIHRFQPRSFVGTQPLDACGGALEQFGDALQAKQDSHAQQAIAEMRNGD